MNLLAASSDGPCGSMIEISLFDFLTKGLAIFFALGLAFTLYFSLKRAREDSGRITIATLRRIMRQTMYYMLEYAFHIAMLGLIFWAIEHLFCWLQSIQPRVDASPRDTKNVP